MKKNDRSEELVTTADEKELLICHTGILIHAAAVGARAYFVSTFQIDRLAKKKRNQQQKLASAKE